MKSENYIAFTVRYKEYINTINNKYRYLSEIGCKYINIIRNCGSI